ncbi:Kelch repeat-containing protein [Exophiala dermatitidis]
MASPDVQYLDREPLATPAIASSQSPGRPRRRNTDNDSTRSSRDVSPRSDASQRRNSAFLEVGLGGEDMIVDAKLRKEPRHVRFRNEVDFVEPEPVELSGEASMGKGPRAAMPLYFPTLPRLLFLALVVVLVIPSLHTAPLSKVDANPVGARGGQREDTKALQGTKRSVSSGNIKRDNSPTEVCKRWSQQSAVVNGTLYLYGGRATTTSDQTQNTWNNDFLAIDLTKSWQISSPSLTGLPVPSGPPAVSLGYLWNSFDALYLYGGEFSDSPVETPVPFSTWAYDISSSTWSELQNPKTSAGTNSEPANQPVQRAAEGAGVSIPGLGRGFYFGGHLDGYTTPGWSQSIARVYIKGLLEYTFPGYSNAAVDGNHVAGDSGIYRNVTQGGTQDSAGFPERADGLLVYVPGYGKSGIIIGLAGGTNSTFTQMNVIDVYDIDTSTWYKQATAGPTPGIRVNPCAVAVSAADGSSTQVYMYGGQNLIPAGQQTQYDDMWILTIPSFTWIQVNTSNQATPPARAGHTCNLWNSQMVVVGGYTGQELSCESPGIYVFNTSSLTWQNDYYALQTKDDLNRQKSQQDDPSALQGSYGYAVPPAVQSVIGGNAVGAATVTAPAQTASQGPLATGSPITYTVTGADGSVATETAVPGSGSSSNGGGGNNNNKGGSGGSGTNIGAIVAGVIAGCLAILAAYLGFCAWLYRKQLQIYKNHTSMAQRQQLSGDPRYIGAGFVPAKYSDKDKSQTTGTGTGGDSRNSADNRSGNGSSRGGAGGQPHLASNNPYRNATAGGSATAASSTEDLMAGHEPSFLGVVLNPRRSLRVVNRD